MRKAAILIAVGLTFAGCSEAEKKAPSPEGRILFLSDRGEPSVGGCPAGPGCESEIYVMNADGSGLVQLSDSPGDDGGEGGFAWSPDQKRIAYVHTGLVHTQEGIQPEVFVVNADGSGRRSVGSWGFVGGPGREPQWSPDGTTIAFSGEGGFVVVEADGSGKTLFARDVLSHGPAAFVGGRFWSPDGKRVALAFGDGFYVANPDGASRVALVRPLRNLIPIWAWSPDGTMLAFTQASGVYVARADGSAVTRVLASPTPAFGLSDPVPPFAWTPDGRLLVTERKGDIVAVNPDGSGFLSITSGPQSDTFPLVSPDGSKILFLRGDKDENGELMNDALYVVNVDGSGLRMLVAPEVGSADWSPDGKWIVFSRRESPEDHNQEIYVMKADGSGIRNITRNGAGDAAPRWAR